MAAIAKQRSDRKNKATGFGSVTERDNPFLALWPHRFDYLFAPHPNPDDKPDWQTESRHPLNDRLILQGSYLYGVRMGTKTRYAVLDIDAGSPYSPRRDPLAVKRICAALEPLGLVEHIVITSSRNGGIHIYFPFDLELPSWQIAIAIAALLENAGFKIMAGWLEVFPNRKSYSEQPTLFNGHRLPLQQGSYLLNEELSPLVASATHGEQMFTRQWQQAIRRNDICEQTLAQTIKEAKRNAYQVSNKAEKFLNDLHADIEPGWSGKGQTNELLGRIALRSYVFGHVLYAPAPLTSEDLVTDIVRIAKSLPGYTEFCGHQHEIEKRARDWAKQVEKDSRYYPYRNGRAPKKNNDGLSWNDQQRLAARDRIRAAAVALFREDKWPEGITARYKALCAAGISGRTIYAHKDLWHPDHLSQQLSEPLTTGEISNQSSAHEETANTPVEIPPNPPLFEGKEAGLCAGGAALTPYGPNLLGGVGGNRLTCNDHRSSGPLTSPPLQEPGGNAVHVEVWPPQPSPKILRQVKEFLAIGKAHRDEAARSRKAAHLEEKRSAAMAQHRAKLQGWIESGDPVLKAEALKQLAKLRE